MCMSCSDDSENNSGRRFSKKRIAILSTMGAGAVGALYLSVTTNPAIGAPIYAILAFAACPTMCAAMGGSMWLSRRLSKKKGNAQQIQQKQKTKEEEEVYNLETRTDKQQEKFAIAVTETNDEKTISPEQHLPRGQRKKRKTNQEGQKST
jgi:uncharacterized membrane protein YhiD involved in acid resistance